MLLKRFPKLTEEQITEAHGYAYGGAVIQDLGYYPFGNAEFSNLVHYVRTGDFVRELLFHFDHGELAVDREDILGKPRKPSYELVEPLLDRLELER